MSGTAGHSGGRNRKPRRLKALAGTLRADRVAADAPDAPALAQAPAAPSWLPKGARRHFRRLAERAIALQVLADTDLEALALAAAALEEYLSADALVRAEGLTVATENGPRKHPGVAIRADAWRRYRDALRAFGFSPADRDHVARVRSGRRNAFSRLGTVGEPPSRAPDLKLIQGGR